MKVEVYMKLLNETLVQYRNRRNSIGRAGSTPWQYNNTINTYKNRFTNIKKTFSLLNNIYYNYVKILTHRQLSSINQSFKYAIDFDFAIKHCFDFNIFNHYVNNWASNATTAYIKCKKATRITISFKYTDSVEISLIDSTCTFYSFMPFDCAMIFLFLNTTFIFLSMMLQNICLNNLKETVSNSRRRISISVFNICLMTLMKLNCFLMICVSFFKSFRNFNDFGRIKLNFSLFFYI